MSNKTCRLWISIVLAFTLLSGFAQHGHAQSVGEYDVTLEMLGYQDVRLSETTSSTYYAFNLPIGWEIQQGNYLTLDFEYRIHLPEGVAYPPALVEVRFNNEILQVDEVLTPTARRLQVELPADQFRLSEDTRPNVIEVSIDVIAPCELVLRSVLTIKNTSSLHLAYTERPLSVDLARFPSLIYQRYAFEPSHVRFVLPDAFDEADVRAAAVVAARLGQLTSHQLPISVTVASEQLASSRAAEHLLVLGQPDDNPMIGQLNLPIALAERQLALSSQMPTTVSKGSVLTYTLSVENTSATGLSVIVEDRFPAAGVEFLECGAACRQVASGKIRWDVGQLAAGQQASTSVVVRVKSNTSSDSFRHTATLLDQQGIVLNGDTRSTHIGEGADEEAVVSPEQESGTFFVQGQEAVAEDAGVLQEIVSPVDARRVVVVVTGLSDEAVLKAARGLNPRNYFPGMSGNTAVIEGVNPLPDAAPTYERNIPFVSLGYGNSELNVVELEAREYVFDFPPGSTLGEGSHLALHLAHAEIVSAVGGGIKVTLNNVPIGGAVLDDANLNDAWLLVPLNRMAVRPGTNRIRVQATIDYLDPCIVTRGNPYWAEIYADSFLSLDFRPTQMDFDLVRFPYPLNTPGDMTNVLFALPEDPSLTDVEGLLRIASLVGSGSESKTFIPQVAFGVDADQASLSDYHVMAIGLPTTNPLIRSANAHLPQPFLVDSNDIYQSIDGPIYGIPPGADLGLAQELTSPWDNAGEHALVIATGVTDAGVRQAVSVLSQPSRDLGGDLVFVRDGGVHSIDTQPIVAMEVFSIPTSITATVSGAPSEAAVETATPEPVSEQTPQATTQQPDSTQVSAGATPEEDAQVTPPTPARPTWLILLVIVGVLSIVGVVVLKIRKVL